MKIPVSIRIGGVEYKITDAESLNDGCNLLNGNIDYVDSSIALRREQGHQQKCITMWHEIVHGILYHMSVELENDVEEKIAETLGFGLYQVLQDNGERLFDIIGNEGNDEHENADGDME